ncbi:MAG: TlpA disulfide reductase family protein [Planctomycetota bacterium]|nr:TlpA family protein disulfide reductase [Planctomycetota bacterium]MCX8040020.1 TlpA family protein disulfide reductase [Planctomycetota bacterium]MDW8372608.1 TlpA disulfide reductase family protein [Planctomycetota bacterium]
MFLRLLVIGWLMRGALAAASAADVLAEAEAGLDPVVRAEPGNPARAQAIAAALARRVDLPPAERLEVELALAEAWLDAAQPASADALACGVLSQPAASGSQRARAALLRLGVARALLQNGDADTATRIVEEVLAAGGDDASVVTFAWVVRGEIAMSWNAQRQMRDRAGALAAFDTALARLAGQPAEWRVPIYLLRVTAMERAGASPGEVRAWLDERAGDAAAVSVRALLQSPRERLLGQPAPPLTGQRLDRGDAAAFDLARLRGRPVIVAFFVPDAAPTRDLLLPALRQLAAQRPEAALVGVCRLQGVTPPEATAWLAAQAVDWPVLADADDRLLAAWRVDLLPSVFLVAADGTVAAVDLLRGTREGLVQAVLEALQRLPAAGTTPRAFP